MHRAGAALTHQRPSPCPPEIVITLQSSTHKFSIQSSRYEQNTRSLCPAPSLNFPALKFNNEMEKFPDQKLKWIRHYASKVTLDLDSAYRSLTLSDDGKEVREGKLQKRPFNPKRFTGLLGSLVIAKEGHCSLCVPLPTEAEEGWGVCGLRGRAGFLLLH